MGSCTATTIWEEYVNSITKIAILGGGAEELNLLSEFHHTPGVVIVAIYDRDPRSVALEISEIIGVPTFSDDSFLPAFQDADYIIVTEKRKFFQREIALLQKYRKRIINPSEAINYLVSSTKEIEEEGERSLPVHLEEALQYIDRITDRERLLKWLLELSVRVVEASSGSIMLYSKQTKELYIGYAIGLSPEVIKKTRQRIGEGIAGNVAESRRARLIREIVDTHLYREDRERYSIQSAISAPLVMDEKLLGVLNISTNAGEKRLGEEDVRIIENLASQIAPILDQHLKIDYHEIREIEFQIRSYLESLFHRDIGFHDKFTLLCKFLVDKLEADTVTIYTATDEGDWLILGGSDQQIPIGSQNSRIHCIKGSLARAYLNGEEVIMTEVSHELGMRLKFEQGAMTSIYIPLEHDESVGVLVVEFSKLEALERFLRFKDALRFQISLFTYSQLRELRQTRRMESLEKLSLLTPTLVSLREKSSKIQRLPALLSSLVKASRGSFHLKGPHGVETSYQWFPEDENERKVCIEYDTDIMERVAKSWEPECTSYLSIDIDMIDKPPLYRSIIAYPLFRSDDTAAVYIGYDKVPSSPLDSSIFGRHEIDLLKKVEDILVPLLAGTDEERQKKSPISFDSLLKSNQKILIERIGDEIERADRYHHGFTLTLFKINGLKKFFKRNYQDALGLINDVSQGIRRQVRKTDYFSWIEVDLFGVLSLESYQRIGYLESRLTEFITSVLKEKGLNDAKTFYPVTGYALFPGTSETPSQLINEAKSKLPSS